jgi:hypothetical protein
MYKDVAKNLGQFEIKKPDTIVPNPTQADYSNGHIRRYFVRKSNDTNSIIYEISKETSEKYSKNPFWKTGSIKWRLTGTIEQMSKSNEAAILYVKSTFPTLPLYLPNLAQFYIEPQ